MLAACPTPDHAVASYNSLGPTFEFYLSRDPVTTLGQKIKRLRLERALKQTDLAEALGVAENTVRNWEKDRQVPAAWHLRRLREFFEVTF